MTYLRHMQESWHRAPQAGVPYSGPAVSTPARIGPLLLAEAKLHFRLDTSDEDELVLRFLNEAQDCLQDDTRRILLTSTAIEYYDVWPWDYLPLVHLHRAPVSSITSITYYDTSDVQQTWASTNYETDLVNEPARIHIAEAATLTSPTIDERLNCVAITYVAGYGLTLASLPNIAVEAIKRKAYANYECRELSTAEERIWLSAVRRLIWCL